MDVFRYKKKEALVWNNEKRYERTCTKTGEIQDLNCGKNNTQPCALLKHKLYFIKHNLYLYKLNLNFIKYKFNFKNSYDGRLIMETAYIQRRRGYSAEIVRHPPLSLATLYEMLCQRLSLILSHRFCLGDTPPQSSLPTKAQAPSHAPLS